MLVIPFRENVYKIVIYYTYAQIVHNLSVVFYVDMWCLVIVIPPLPHTLSNTTYYNYNQLIVHKCMYTNSIITIHMYTI